MAVDVVVSIPTWIKALAISMMQRIITCITSGVIDFLPMYVNSRQAISNALLDTTIGCAEDDDDDEDEDDEDDKDNEDDENDKDDEDDELFCAFINS